ncbi:mechanosensitive ion channel family protein [Niveibacterium sp. SC-1]|uniref:mechanosensitive ion channel family protein n=1 Tax=Niveibacterium sp. SC-1 TaxID=3135646 RepID=UPI00311E1831
MISLRKLVTLNTTEDLVMAAATGVAVFVVLFFLRQFFVGRLRKWAEGSGSRFQIIAAEMVSSIRVMMLFAVGLVVTVNNLNLTPALEKATERLVVLIVLVQIGLSAHRGLRTWTRLRIAKQLEAQDGSSVLNLGVITFIALFVLWVTITLLVLENLGVNITALVASLGIGGVAVALAVQNILGDLFASVSIALDKPFVVGDFIIVDDMMGTVRHVGLKTTRIASLSGEELVFSNNDLLKSRIRNYKRMAERRQVFTFGVEYGTPVDKLERIPQIVRDIVQAQPQVRLDRAHFRSFGASSLDFEVVYFLTDPDFNLYMDTQQRINLTLIRELEQLGVRFALPTTRMHIASMAAPLSPAEEERNLPAPPGRMLS